MRNPMLIIHLLSVATFIGAALSAFVLSRVADKLDQEGKIKVKTALLSLNYLGKTGLTLLVITGGYLMTPYWAALGSMPLLVTKLIIVVVLLVVLVLLSIQAKKAKKNPSQMPLLQ
ncbi:hypothetical protein [Saccharicrinis fermentans]|uniref:Uncharacterized protein n=1 Tax=Saccharicrinis fermentans DSM 9555 = JCM 21142 TaxID=869213 RepID=W7Y1R0_9BACT|nr:hypothetical protein [Saccharicrinis fermentans]GAF01453.1 hypothetical protein JCM21142_60 [Saccharicrinis fermentans DSM 9555 = JCM 21142]